MSQTLSQDVITGKAEQRAALVAMQKGSIDEKCRGTTQQEIQQVLFVKHFRHVQGVLQTQIDAVCALKRRTPGLFESLGQWLARFVHELNEYLPVKVEYVEAGFSVCVESMAV